MKVAVWRETAEDERRVALVPEAVRRLTQREIDVGMEPGAGAGAHIPDEAFEEAGATVGAHAVQDAEVVLKVRASSADEVERLEPGQVLIGFLNPLGGGDLIPALASRKVTSFAMEAIPRTTRAQSMDALSSQATVAGYKAALIAAEHLGRFFPMLTTAAGTVAPAKVLVMGAGVAGLQAIATARRLGAIVTAFDVRSVVREQIESLGARFLEIDIGADAEAAGGYARALTEDEQRRQQDALAEAIPQFDAVITTALVPGKPAPKLVIADAVAGMKPGSVIVDLAGEAGGNCELTNPGKTVDLGNVIITAPLNLPATMPEHASQLYARNITSLLELMIGEEGELSLDFGDDIILGACITHDGEIIHLGAREAAPQEA